MTRFVHCAFVPVCRCLPTNARCHSSCHRSTACALLLREEASRLVARAPTGTARLSFEYGYQGELFRRTWSGNLKQKCIRQAQCSIICSSG